MMVGVHSGGQLSRKFQKFCPTFNVEQIKLTPGAIPPLLLFMIINTILQHLDIQSHQGAPIPDYDPDMKKAQSLK